MARVGILGGDSNETAMLFLQMCQEKGLEAMVDLYELTENNVIPVVSIDENEVGAPQIWLLQGATDFAFRQGTGGYLIMNADGTMPPSQGGFKGVITYGFNSRASVTASSVTDGALQVCIQRGFRTLSGSEYEPQEFRADCPVSVDPLNVLGVVTACAMCDVI